MRAEEVAGRIVRSVGIRLPSRIGAKVIMVPTIMPAMAPYLLALSHQMPSRKTGKRVLPAKAKATAVIWAISPGGLTAITRTSSARTRVAPLATDQQMALGGLGIDQTVVDIVGNCTGTCYQ